MFGGRVTAATAAIDSRSARDLFDYGPWKNGQWARSVLTGEDGPNLDVWLGEQAALSAVVRRRRSMLRFPNFQRLLSQQGHQGGAVLIAAAANLDVIAVRFGKHGVDDASRFLGALVAAAAPPSAGLGYLAWATVGLYVPPTGAAGEDSTMLRPGEEKYSNLHA